MNKSFENDRIKEDIKSRLDIVDIISRYVALKPAGANMKGLCPFHKEKTPSFTVNREKGVYYCFGCHQSGDVFQFLMEKESMTFPEVLKMTAEETGVKLPKLTGNYEPQNSSGTVSKSHFLQIYKLAVDFYYNSMRHNNVAINYLKNRGLKPETVRDFRLGFAPPGWNNLINHAQKFGIDKNALVETGLAIQKKETDSVYDRFRERIIFPIFDSAGHPIAFGARAMGKDEQPKYLNSPETILYKKNKTLYGLNASRQSIRENKFAIFVEGYMDFLSMYQAGIKNCVASSGTALTQEHGDIIRRFTSKIVLVFDGDNAGIEAAQRGVNILLPLGLDVRVLILPNKEDPDSFIKNNGVEAMNESIKNAITGFSFILKKSIESHGIDSPQSKSAVITDIAELAKNISDNIVLREYVKQTSELLGVNENLVFTKFRKFTPKQQFTSNKQPTISPADNYDETIEGGLIRLLLHNPSLIELSMEKISDDTFSDQFTKNLYSLIVSTYQHDSSLKTITEKSITDTQKQVIIRQLLAEPWPGEHAKDDLNHAILRLKAKALKSKLKDIRNMQKTEQDPLIKERLLKEHKEISISLKELGIGW